jgi:hypothetical protein
MSCCPKSLLLPHQVKEQTLLYLEFFPKSRFDAVLEFHKMLVFNTLDFGMVADLVNEIQKDLHEKN